MRNNVNMVKERVSREKKKRERNRERGLPVTSITAEAISEGRKPNHSLAYLQRLDEALPLLGDRLDFMWQFGFTSSVISLIFRRRFHHGSSTPTNAKTLKGNCTFTRGNVVIEFTAEMLYKRSEIRWLHTNHSILSFERRKTNLNVRTDSKIKALSLNCVDGSSSPLHSLGVKPSLRLGQESVYDKESNRQIIMTKKIL
ncbi:hypothetical protein M9H77_21654 [Catharanthus roseus]|uniref:Uncharacterized protein n=1 Tax=Catharanthus roseus TaxID=4058 RepID=A0ACC0ANY5_CATRO|nr:hypothetical protein M9H77_21654 [Catharanthus roseus]